MLKFDSVTESSPYLSLIRYSIQASVSYLLQIATSLLGFSADFVWSTRVLCYQSYVFSSI